MKLRAMRTCIGRHFALVEAQLILASVARKHRLRLELQHLFNKITRLIAANYFEVPIAPLVIQYEIVAFHN